MKNLSLVTLKYKTKDNQILKEAILMEEKEALFLEKFLYLLFYDSKRVSIPLPNGDSLKYRDIVILWKDLTINPVTNYFQSWKESYSSTKIGAISYLMSEIKIKYNETLKKYNKNL